MEGIIEELSGGWSVEGDYRVVKWRLFGGGDYRGV